MVYFNKHDYSHEHYPSWRFSKQVSVTECFFHQVKGERGEGEDRFLRQHDWKGVLENNKIPKVFTQHHPGHCCTNAIRGQC
jgi:hypothetical protein